MPYAGASWSSAGGGGAGPWANLISYIPDEIPLGQQTTLRVTLLNPSGAIAAFTGTPNGEVYGAGETVLLAATAMTAVGSDWTLNYTPTTSGPQVLVVTGTVSGSASAYAASFTARPKFDPIGLAVSDVFVSRM